MFAILFFNTWRTKCRSFDYVWTRCSGKRNTRHCRFFFSSPMSNHAYVSDGSGERCTKKKRTGQTNQNGRRNNPSFKHSSPFSRPVSCHAHVSRDIGRGSGKQSRNERKSRAHRQIQTTNCGRRVCDLWKVWMLMFGQTDPSLAFIIWTLKRLT